MKISRTKGHGAGFSCLVRPQLLLRVVLPPSGGDVGTGRRTERQMYGSLTDIRD